MTPTTEQRAVALCYFLESAFRSIRFSEIVANDLRGDGTFTDTFGHFGVQYRVMTPEEAQEAVREEIRGSLWTFQASFLLRYLPLEVHNGEAGGEHVEQALRTLQERLCEDANPMILAMVHSRFDEVVAAAIEGNGRGHFLSPYDGQEGEVSRDGQDYFVYKMEEWL